MRFNSAREKKGKGQKENLGGQFAFCKGSGFHGFPIQTPKVFMALCEILCNHQFSKE